MRDIPLVDIKNSEKILISSDIEFYTSHLGDTSLGDPTSDYGVLLVHGFTGSNLELLYLGNYLANYGYRVMIVLLPGHGTNFEDLKNYNLHDWKSKIQEVYDVLQKEKKGRKIVIGGHSLGGALLLNIVRDLSCSGIVLMATPIRYNWITRVYVILRGRTGAKMYYAGFRFHNKELLNNPLTDFFDTRYEYIYFSSLREVFRAMESAYSTLPLIDTPIKLIYGTDDYRVGRSHPKIIMDRIASLQKELVWIKRTDHILVIDTDHALVAEEFFKFCESLKV